MERNPWLDVPVEDYLGHMGSAQVGQLPVLADLFGEALAHFAPRRLLVLGCGTGHGFERIDPDVTERVVGVELNPTYLDRLRSAFPTRPFEMELTCCDASEYAIPEGAFDLVCAALFFEYVEWPRLVPHIAAGVAPGGGVAAVVQLPSASAPAVSASAFPGVRVLEPLFRFVDPAALRESLVRCGLMLESEKVAPLPQGKAFGAYHFRKNGKG